LIKFEITMKTKKIFLLILILVTFSITILPIKSNATTVGTHLFGGELDISGNTAPYLFSCGNKVFLDDQTEPGRTGEIFGGGGLGEKLIERMYPSLFEGEVIIWDVLVMDLDGINDIILYNNDHGYHKDSVYATVGKDKGFGNQIEVNCLRGDDLDEYVNYDLDYTPEDCNAKIGDHEIEKFDSEFMRFYRCFFTVETPDSMYGENWITVEAEDKLGNIGKVNEDIKYFLNPTIAISVSDSEDIFDDLEPGEISYSDSIYIENKADIGSGVLMDLFISGTDFYDTENESSFCPKEDKLSLDRFSYFAKNGDYDTKDLAGSDNMGYRSIEYGIGFSNPDPFYDTFELIPKGRMDSPLDMYFNGNIIGPDDEVEIKLKLDIPEFCKGNFDSGNLYIWGEAI